MFYVCFSGKINFECERKLILILKDIHLTYTINLTSKKLYENNDLNFKLQNIGVFIVFVVKEILSVMKNLYFCLNIYTRLLQVNSCKKKQHVIAFIFVYRQKS